MGRIRIEPKANFTVDIFVTHTIADSGTKLANNTWYRVKQVSMIYFKMGCMNAQSYDNFLYDRRLYPIKCFHQKNGINEVCRGRRRFEHILLKLGYHFIFKYKM